jgi:lysozyme family protein
MQTVEDIARDIVAREGGFVDDPDDPGGATKHGVTIHTMRRLGLDLTGDGRIDARDVHALGPEEAADIFVRHYFRDPRLGGLPACLHASIFDMYVNAGANAVKILQTLLRDLDHDIAVDGVVGPRTIAAASAVADLDAALFRDAYGIARRNYYFRIADGRSTSRKYVRTRAGGKGGWITRAEEFISSRFHLSDADFRKRTAAWD